MNKRIKDISGNKYNRLTAIRYVEQSKTNRHAIWEFECECGNHIKCDRTSVEHNKTKSCGCLKIEKSRENGLANSKTNVYRFENDFITGTTYNTEAEFYFDIIDYELIVQYCWTEDSNGYIFTQTKGNKTIRLHQLIMNSYNESVIVDHKDRNKYNNRRNNLRLCNKAQNCSNINLRKDNTSGVIGVSWRTRSNCWYVQIQKNNKCHYIGSFDDKEDAIKARLNAEKKYFGDFAPQQHLYESYGIE